jgi:hypothetical protein
MKYKFIGILVFLASGLLEISCTKISSAAPLYPETPKYIETSPVFDTVDLVLNQWEMQTDQVYRNIFNLPDNHSYGQVFVQDSEKYKQLGPNAINYLGGQLSYEDHSGVNIAYFYTDSAGLPFDSLSVRVVIEHY